MTGFSCSILNSAPQSSVCSMNIVGDWPSKPIETIRSCQQSLVDAMHDFPLSIPMADLFPTYTVPYGQPLRRSGDFSQPVWGVSIGIGCHPDWKEAITSPFQIVWSLPSTNSQDFIKGLEEERRRKEWGLENERRYLSIFRDYSSGGSRKNSAGSESSTGSQPL